jgi:cell division protein FtsL
VTVTKHAAVKELSYNSASPVFLINTIILLVAGLLMVYYVIQANMIAAGNYKIKLLNQKLESLNEVRSSLAAQESSIEDPAKVLDFALSHGMVEAKNAVYIFENGNVALRP